MITPWKVLIWVQSLLGSGHLRRAVLLAEALARSGAEVVVANGGRPGPWPAPVGVRVVQLPAITARGTDLGELVDRNGAPVADSVWEERRRILTDLLAGAPHAVITEMFPFGRRAFRPELVGWLRAVRVARPRPVIVASVRDVLVSKPDPARYHWMVETCLEHYDHVLVHGDARLLAFADSFPPAAALEGRVAHTGFVLDPSALRSITAAPAVLVSAGGGAVGEDLLRAAIAARPLTSLASAPWLLVGGQNLAPATFETLRALLPPAVDLVQYRADLAALMGACEVSVCQAGYNSVVEGLAVGARMVLVPFAAGAEDEQERRARRLEALGLAERVGEREVDGTTLAAAVERARARPRPDPGLWSFDGAARAASLIAGWVHERYDDA